MGSTISLLSDRSQKARMMRHSRLEVTRLLFCMTNVYRLHLHLRGLKQTFIAACHSGSSVASQVSFCVECPCVLCQVHTDRLHAQSFGRPSITCMPIKCLIDSIFVKLYQHKRNISECDMQLNGGNQVNQIRRLKTRELSHTVHSLQLPLLPSLVNSLRGLIRW